MGVSLVHCFHLKFDHVMSAWECHVVSDSSTNHVDVSLHLIGPMTEALMDAEAEMICSKENLRKKNELKALFQFLDLLQLSVTFVGSLKNESEL